MESRWAFERALSIGDKNSDHYYIISIAQPNYADPIADDEVRAERERAVMERHRELITEVG